MRALTRAMVALTVTTAAAAALVPLSSAAWARSEGSGSTDCNHTDWANTCYVGVSTTPQRGSSPAQPVGSTGESGSTGDSGPACYWDRSRRGVSSRWSSVSVPCHSPAGYWSNAHDCYVKLMKPQPAASDPVWRGHRPGDGAVYDCYQARTDMIVPIWAANPPAGPGRQLTPEQVAQLAIKRLTMHPVRVGLAPTPVETSPEALGVIGIPVWMWVKNPTAGTYSTSDKPQTVSASAGGITVTAKAYVERVEWDMGDDSAPISCGAGTAYTEPADNRPHPSPDCGYTYTETSWDKPNHEYAVTANSYWRVDWSGAGQQGTIRLPALVSTVHIKEGELQVLNN